MNSPNALSTTRLLTPFVAGTLLLSAALLFWIQPLFSKMILPRLGGTPAVWNTCLVFFQSVLFAGYFYVFLINRLPLRVQMGLHLCLLLASLLTVPIAMPQEWVPPVQANPIPALLELLLRALGLPFFLLSASAPLLQNWYRQTQQPDAEDPYYLYSASNAGSLGILLLYPFLLEPVLPLTAQLRIWTSDYILLIAAIGGNAWLILRNVRSEKEPVEWDEPPRPAVVRLAQRLRWMALSLVPSGYLYGVTQYITTDLAAVPLLWVIPLALYLLTFVLAFVQRQIITRDKILLIQAVLILPTVLSLAWHSPGLFWFLYPLHLLAFFFSAWVCHQQLAESRPKVPHLAEYYVWIALGGMVGGILCALLAPVIFNSILEYPIFMVLACLLRPRFGKKHWIRDTLRDMVIPALIAMVLPGIVLLLELQATLISRILLALVLIAVCGLCLWFRRQPVRFGLMVGTLALVGILHISGQHNVIHQERSFYGVLRVSRDESRQYHLFTHGTTTHGAQSQLPEERRKPLTYFHAHSPIAQVFERLNSAPSPRNVAVVGLGIGTLACYARAEDTMTFYEIDPAVEEIARNPLYFTYLQDCPSEVKVVLGDARISLANEPDQAFDMIIMDAFSSDSIPVHLVTREAMELYCTKLKAGGLILFQISNRYLNLESVIANIARSFQVNTGIALPAYTQAYEDTSRRSEMIYPSRWMIWARNADDIRPIVGNSSWREAQGNPSARVWTDDYSNILCVIEY